MNGFSNATRLRQGLIGLAMLVLLAPACARRSPRPASPGSKPLPGEPTACHDVPAADPVELALRLRGIAAPIATPPAPPQESVGTRHTFRTLDLQHANSMQVSASLVHVTDHLKVWVEDGLEVDLHALRQSADDLERLYPLLREQFGTEWTPGIDNDPRISILNTRFPGATAYFTSSDEYPSALVPQSNEREMFYVNPLISAPGTPGYVSALAHEFQHMIHWRADPNEDTWINEGASELAGEMAGAPLGNAMQDLAADADLSLVHWADERMATHYGASYLFLSYLRHRLGNDAVRALVAGNCNGITGVQQVLDARARGVTFDQLFAQWTAANYLFGRNSPAEGPLQNYPALKAQFEPHEVITSYPSTIAAAVQQYGADYVLLRPSTTALRVTFEGDSSARIVPTTARSGRSMWWSNRGSNSDMTLTRSFDLRNASRATLRAWLWYDIERGWDHAYAEVSTDGGNTWQLLSGGHTTTDDPTRSSYGPGYTGRSGSDGGAARAVWIEEAFDLTPFAGQQIEFRFEYVTDDAMNGAGLCVDDVRLPELGFTDDAETPGGWEAQGFLRIADEIPQRLMVHLLRLGKDPTLERMPLGEDQRGSLKIEGLQDEAVLIVSGTTPDSTEPAEYRIQLQVSAD